MAGPESAVDDSPGLGRFFALYALANAYASSTSSPVTVHGVFPLKRAEGRK